MPSYKVLREGQEIKLVEVKPGDVTDTRSKEPVKSHDQRPGGDGQMTVGWMWLDADRSRTLEEKVERAAERFRAKFGHWPDVCHVNSRAAPEGNFVCGRVRIVAAPNILPHHFWLGPLEKVA